MQTIDYSKYSYHELHEALNAVDQEQFPDNYQAIIRELEVRKASAKDRTFADKERPFFAGFWRRVFAHILDTIILALPLVLIGFFLFDYLAALGSFGILVGFIISATYFTLGYSHIFGGQTIGKAIVDIKVIDQQGQLLSPSRAFIRYLTLDFPYYISGILMLWARPDGLFGFALSLLSSLVLLASIYLLIFNRPTRRTLHDYIASSMVINHEATAQTLKPLWKGHYGFLISIILIVIFFNLLAFQNYKPKLQALMVFKDVIESKTDYQVTLVTSREFSPPANKGQPIKQLVVDVHTYDTGVDLEAMSDQVSSLLREHSDVAGYTHIYLSVSNGYNLGIAFVRKYQTNYIEL